MKDDPKAAAIPGAVLKQAFPTERAQYKALLLSNPNYFGSFQNAPFPPVLPMAGNTYYEELGCVGYHPQQEMIEGVVYVYQPSGYGGGLCGAGSTEYVRFYLSFDNGASWQDQGLTSFRAWDVPEATEGPARLEYAVQLKVDPARQFCFAGSKLIRVRGILSWNFAPPPNQPNWNPPWGNRRDATIVVEPRRLIFLGELFPALKVKLPPQFKPVLDLQAPIALPPAPLTVPELTALYARSAVPPARFAFKELHALAFGKVTPTPELIAQTLPSLKLEKLPELLFPLPDSDGNTSYEELTCIGLDPNLPDTLVGVVHVKRSSGFSGGPCTAGSTEYVSWWIDGDANGSFETFLGTSSVKTHDIANLPAEGVQLAVRLPVDLEKWRRECHQGPALLRVRAILSWNVAVPGNAPNQVPVWGNREETVVMLAPRGAIHAPAGKIAILGGVPTSMIDAGDGLATDDAVFALNNFPIDGRAPFGGRVTVQGAPVAGGRYRVRATSTVDSSFVVLTPALVLTRSDGTTWTHSADPVTQTYAYVPFGDNINGLLSFWNSAGDDLWNVTLETFDGAMNPLGSDSHRIQLDNTAPVADIAITSGTGNCGKFQAGQLIEGVFTATDAHLMSWSIGIKPPGLNDPGEGITTPSAGSTQETGATWSLDTSGMVGCGYIAEIVVTDRTIVHSAFQGWQAAHSVGFCLEAPAAVDAADEGKG